MLQGTTLVDNLLYSDDIRYMLDALRTLGLKVEDDNTAKRAVVEGCGGLFPVGKDGKEEIQLFLGNAGTAMRPLTAAVAVAGGNSRFVQLYLLCECNFCNITFFCVGVNLEAANAEAVPLKFSYFVYISW